MIGWPKFGLRAKPPIQEARPAHEHVEIDMKQVAAFARGMAIRRGYPDDLAGVIARRAVFLERRGLPGLGSLHHEVVAFDDEPLASRFNRHRPDGREGGHCPIAAGVDLEPHLDMLSARGPNDPLWTTAPSNGLLIVPKIAEWLRINGKRVVFWWEKGGEWAGFIVVEAFRLQYVDQTGTSSALKKLQRADHIGFSDCPDDFQPKPSPRSGFRDTIGLEPRHVALMHDYLKGR